MIDIKSKQLSLIFVCFSELQISIILVGERRGKGVGSYVAWKNDSLMQNKHTLIPIHFSQTNVRWCAVASFFKPMHKIHEISWVELTNVWVPAGRHLITDHDLCRLSLCDGCIVLIHVYYIVDTILSLNSSETTCSWNHKIDDLIIYSENSLNINMLCVTTFKMNMFKRVWGGVSDDTLG